MTTEQLKKGKEIEDKIKTLRNSFWMQPRTVKPLHIMYEFSKCQELGDPYEREFKYDAGTSELKITGVDEWLREEMINIGDRIKSKMEKKIKELEKELEKL